jgi:hypothetical protein
MNNQGKESDRISLCVLVFVDVRGTAINVTIISLDAFVVDM